MNTNPQIELAERYLRETGVSLFLTGKAGTGKTTFLKHIVESIPKRHAVVAPTGVAAVNAGGVTIHSFFQLPFCPYLPDVKELVTEYQLPEQQKQLRRNKADVIRTLDLLIIDEISMVRADLLDAIDAVLRRYRRNSRPFGGVQLLMIGDVQQLPPVVTDSERPYLEQVYPSPFFFHSKALQRLNYITIELQTVYRQQDAAFLTLLNKIRDNQFDSETLATLNERVAPQQINKSTNQHLPPKTPIRLVTHNHQADGINQRELDALTSKLYTFSADVDGNFPDTSAPTERNLQLKVGAQVMFVKNDTSGGHRYFNGKIGTVTRIAFNDDEPEIVVTDDNGDEIQVARDKWENIRYEIDAADNQIKQKIDGTFLQYPLRLAWAVTIHKAQGLTFDRVVVDAAAAFSYGQVYVALSRCRSLEGLTLSSPISSRCAFDNRDVASFVESFPDEKQVSGRLDDYRRQYYFDILLELFGFGAFERAAERLSSLFVEKLRTLYPKHVEKITEQRNLIVAMVEVSEKFHRQLLQIPQSQHPERIGKGTAYFVDQLTAFATQFSPLLKLSIDNKEVAKVYDEDVEQFSEILGQKLLCLTYVRDHGFTIDGYLQQKARYLLNKSSAQNKSTNQHLNKSTPQQFAYEGVANSELARRLAQWRRNVAEERNIPAYCVLQQKALIAIADQMPRTTKELMAIKGFGKIKCKQFGEEILDLIADYIEDNGD